MNRNFLKFAICISAVLVVSSCGFGKKEILIAGSATLQPALAECARLFENAYPGYRVQVDGGGSLQGVATVLSGTAQIGALSRELSEEEQAFDLIGTVIGYDGIAIIVNKANPVTNLTKEQVAAIYKGEIKSWAGVGGPDWPITPIRKEKEHGTQKVFENFLEFRKKDLPTDMLTIGPNSQTVIQTAHDSGAIAYVSIGSIDRAEATDMAVKRVALDGVMPTQDSVKSQTYALVRPLVLVTKGVPAEPAQLFLDFVMTPPAQSVIEREDFIKITMLKKE